MNSVIQKCFGLEEVRFEDPASDELQLKVGAIGLNRLEVVFRSGGFGAPNKYPAVLGSECAGTVEAIGKDVTGFKVGDRVATTPGFTTLPGCATESRTRRIRAVVRSRTSRAAEHS